jgi:ferritin-like metal-binding protein YciE
MDTRNQKPNRKSSENIPGRKDSKLFHLFRTQLQDIYWAEQKLVRTLPKLQESASSGDLKQAFSSHLLETRGHVGRLENIFQILGEETKSTKCRAISGIIDEGEDLIKATADGTAERDAALIFAGQKAEHYEMATYGGLKQLAITLGFADIADILNQTLSEEKKADALLTKIAQTGINEQARQELIEETAF